MVKVLANMPELKHHEADLWRAFRECHRSRQGGWGTSPIAQQEMQAWFEINDILIDERPFFTEAIAALDDEWREVINRKTEHRKPKAKDDGSSTSSD